MKRSTALNLKSLVRLIPINHKLYFSRSSRDKTFRHCLSDISTCPRSTFLLPEWSRSHWSQTVLSACSRHLREKVTVQPVKNFTAYYKHRRFITVFTKKPLSYQRICVIQGYTIVGVLTTCHTQYTCDRSTCVFYSIEQHYKFLLHTLQVFYMCTLCDSTDINTIIEFVPNCL